MKHLVSVAVGWLILLATASVFAQQPSYGYYYTWGGPWGWDVRMMVVPIMLLFTIACILALVDLLARSFYDDAHHHWYRHAGYPHGGHSYRRNALDILEEHFAKGEVGRN